MLALYERIVLHRPRLVLASVLGLLLLALAQFPKIKIDASADSLLLQGDPALEYFREVSQRYESQDFIVITWKPYAGLLSDESLMPLGEMADELRELPGVASVVTVLDVPLLQSPPIGLSQVTGSDPLPSLKDAEIDRALALQEFRNSPLYSDLLVSPDGDVTAVQINIASSGSSELINERELLRARKRDAELTSQEQVRLLELEALVKQKNAEVLASQSQLVAAVRSVVDKYRDAANIFVGGVPMITADMVSFVRSDLKLFGGAILGVMVLILALIFRRPKWVLIPLFSCSISVAYTLGILGFLDWRMTVISSNVVAVLLIVALAIAIHLVVRYRELQRNAPEGDHYERVRETMRLMAVPCVYTGLTTMVAFVSLVVSGIQPVIDFGWMMTLGICVALLVSFSFVPAMMLLWGDGKAAPKGAEEGEPFTMRFAKLADRHGNAVIVVSLALAVLVGVGISRLKVENRFIDYFKESTEIYQGMELLDARLGGTIPLDIIVAAPDQSAPLPGLELTTSGDSLPLAADDPFAESDPFLGEMEDPFAAEASVDETFGESLGEADAFAEQDDFADDPFADDDFGASDDDAAFADDAFADATATASQSSDPGFWFSFEGLRTIDLVQDTVESYNETGKVQSLSTTFELFRQLLGDDIGSVELALAKNALPADISGLLVDPYYNASNDEARITVRVKETSRDLQRAAFLRDLNERLREDVGLEQEQIRFTGMLVMYNNVLQSLYASQIQTLGAVFGVILLMFWILFRSFSLALIALAPNILAAGLVLGIMGLLGIPLDIMTITIAAIVVGIGVDNCIHYVHRFKREFPIDRNYLATMYRCHGSIGRALYYTTLTLVIGFSTLTLSNFNPSLYFGVLTVIAMAAAVIGALLLLPRLILLFKPLGPSA
ncbi:MAG: MMPL family transporter [Pseudomonadota bacterium]